MSQQVDGGQKLEILQVFATHHQTAPRTLRKFHEIFCSPRPSCRDSYLDAI